MDGGVKMEVMDVVLEFEGVVVVDDVSMLFDVLVEVDGVGMEGGSVGVDDWRFDYL